MPADTPPLKPALQQQRSDAYAALRVSALSVVWTIASSSAAITIGLLNDTAVLIAFGAIGIVDAMGSLALVYHFGHSLRHGRLSDELEQLAHTIVLVGLLLVGCAALLGGIVRLVSASTGEPSALGVLLAAVSLFVLAGLSIRKHQIAQRIGSRALLSDGHLSAVGATQAGVAIAGTAMTRWLGWHAADAAATAVLGGVAISLATATWRAEHRAASDAVREPPVGPAR